MPIMEIVAPAWEAFLPIQVFAYMIYPKDESARQAFIAHKCGEIALKTAQKSNAAEVALPTGLLEIILKTCGTKAHEVPVKTVLSGAVASHILLALIEMQAEGVEPSVNKAIHLAKAFFKRAESRTGHKVTAADTRSYRRYWADYKPVAHLWAATQFAADPLHHDHWRSAMQDDSLRILALARDLLHAAEGITNTNSSGPILDREKMWTLPGTILLPGQQMTCSGLTDIQRKDLESYDPRDYTGDY
ncbi:hypothetical protein [Azorhizophilus paspali]|uniref:Uncharacterized protein n=1 Tax=Azorhizophilus paspali TaxID=69963 RepID=A0ABV6SJM8_AZOPA